MTTTHNRIGDYEVKTVFEPDVIDLLITKKPRDLFGTPFRVLGLTSLYLIVIWAYLRFIGIPLANQFESYFDGIPGVIQNLLIYGIFYIAALIFLHNVMVRIANTIEGQPIKIYNKRFLVKK